MTYLKATLEKLRNPVHNFRIAGNQTENSAVASLNTSLGVTATVAVPNLNVSLQFRPSKNTRKKMRLCFKRGNLVGTQYRGSSE